jgi:hypothetical protein
LPKPEPAKVEEGSTSSSTPSPAAPAKLDAGAPDTIDTNKNLDELSHEAQKIIDEARVKLEALAKGKKTHNTGLAAGALLFAGTRRSAEQENAVAQAAEEEAGQDAGAGQETTFEETGRKFKTDDETMDA